MVRIPFRLRKGFILLVISTIVDLPRRGHLFLGFILLVISTIVDITAHSPSLPGFILLVISTIVDDNRAYFLFRVLSS